jgi:hypothetical protein
MCTSIPLSQAIADIDGLSGTRVPYRNFYVILDCVHSKNVTFVVKLSVFQLVTVAARSKARTAFARSDTGIVVSNHIQCMDVWCVYAFILCLCCPVFR